MKREFNNFVQYALPLVAAIALASSGCGKPAAKTESADSFGTNKLETVFADAAAPVKTALQKAEGAISSKDYGTAYDALQVLAKDKSLTPEQLEALKNSMQVLGNFPRRAP